MVSGDARGRPRHATRQRTISFIWIIKNGEIVSKKFPTLVLADEKAGRGWRVFQRHGLGNQQKTDGNNLSHLPSMVNLRESIEYIEPHETHEGAAAAKSPWNGALVLARKIIGH
jgi:hypothetical protein